MSCARTSRSHGVIRRNAASMTGWIDSTWPKFTLIATFIVTAIIMAARMSKPTASNRPRARDLGLVVGILPAGPGNAITDVAGVRVGHATVIAGDRVRTGVTAIVPHAR